MALQGTAKRNEIDSLLRQLDRSKDLSPGSAFALLERIKVLGRDPKDADAIYSKNGIEILSRYGIDRVASIKASREALGCLANATLLQPRTRQILVDLGRGPDLADLYLKTYEIEDEFLCARLLLMLTAGTNLNYGKLITEHELADCINQAIARHSETSRVANADDPSRIPTPSMALSETLKLLYSLLSVYPKHAQHFAASTTPLVKVLMTEKINDKKPMDPPMSHIVNALFKFDTSTFDEAALFPTDDPTRVSRTLLTVLSKTAAAYPDKELDISLSPGLGLIGEMAKIAPAGVRDDIKKGLLPSDDERTKPLGQADTLPAKLLRLSTSGYTPELRKIIPTVLFELSDCDAETFVKNVGFGYAAGFLNNNQIPLPAQDPRASDAGAETGRQVNPVTGQFLADEPESSQPPMTEEEKEREAERLFVLFERLRATGVMDVRNPVEEAVQSGRFEELE